MEGVRGGGSGCRVVSLSRFMMLCKVTWSIACFDRVCGDALVELLPCFVMITSPHCSLAQMWHVEECSLS
jgi:hypothetical protein